jgi:hypothetical protein
MYAYISSQPECRVQKFDINTQGIRKIPDRLLIIVAHIRGESKYVILLQKTLVKRWF